MDDAIDRMFPKPTTGEWTAESVRLMAVVNTKGAERIVAAHEAALAAEKAKVAELEERLKAYDEQSSV